MKQFIFIVCALFCFSKSHAQAGHATIDSVKVSYKASPQYSASMANGLQAVPQATVYLKNVANLSKIYLRMVDAVTDSTLYTVNYSLSGAAVTSNGITLFQNNSGQVLISTGQPAKLKPYFYKVKTENTSQAQTSEFSVKQ